jgi:hypothetical protein
MEKIKLIEHLFNTKTKGKAKYLTLDDGELRTAAEWEQFLQEKLNPNNNGN